MKLNWSWLLLVALLMVVAYKAGQMREGFFASAYDGPEMALYYFMAFWGIITLIGLIAVARFFYNPQDYFTNHGSKP